MVTKGSHYDWDCDVLFCLFLVLFLFFFCFFSMVTIIVAFLWWFSGAVADGGKQWGES